MTRRKTKRTKTQHLQRPNPNDPLGYRERDSRRKIDTRQSENDQEKPKQSSDNWKMKKSLETIG
jgi:hypothetical protein